MSHRALPTGRRTVVAAAVLLALVACSGPPATVPPDAPSSGPGRPPPTTALADPAGAYRTVPDGRLLVIDRTGVLLDTGDGSVRLLTPVASGGWEAGSSLGEPTPVTGHVAVTGSGALTWTRQSAGATVRAQRVALRSEDLTVPVPGASAAATVTEPAEATGAQPKAGIVLVHEGGPRTRADVDLWARFWAASGFVVLTYDKRGEGASTGAFPGDAPTSAVVGTLAADVHALAVALARRPEVDPARVGLVGHSQAGWVAPAAARGAPVAFLLLMSGSATDGAVEDAFAALTDDGTSDPGLTDARLAARLAGTHGEYDPAASLRALRVPSTWVFGGRDHAVPAALAAAAVRRYAPGATVVRLPSGDHFLYDTPYGTFPEEPAARRYAPGLFAVLLAWAHEHAAARSG